MHSCADSFMNAGMESPVMRLPNKYKRNFSSRLSIDCYVPLEPMLTVDENLVIILDHIVPENTHPKTRQLGHLNNLVAILRKEEEPNFPIKVLLYALRLVLVSESRELRTAGLRCMRHVVKNRQDLRILYNEKVEYFIVKCLDVFMDSESERVQALKLIRHLIHMDPHRVPRIITNSLVSICSSCDDSLRCICTETVCELAVMNPKAFGDFDVVNLLLRIALDIEQKEEISGVLLGVVLHLLNRIENWCYQNLEYVISPLMEVYFHHPKPGKGLEEEKVEKRLQRCKLALNIILSSWTGVSRLCTPNPCGIRSLINLLCISNSRIQQFIMDILFDQLLGKKLHVRDDGFTATLISFVESDMVAWELGNGFVVKEGLDMLNSGRNVSFIDQHRSLLLCCLLQTGLCETLVDVATGSPTPEVVIQATILLAEVLDLCQRLLPAMYETVSICASSLLSNSASSDDLTTKSKARQAVNRLLEHQLVKSRRVEYASLFLQAVLHQTKTGKSEKTPMHQHRDLEPIEPVLRDFQAIFPGDKRTWDWDIISKVLESAYDLPKTNEDDGHYRFVRRLIHFFKPSSRYYAIIRLDEDYAHSLTVLACQLIIFLADSDNAEAAVMLHDLLSDIAHCLSEVTTEAVVGDLLFGPNRVCTSLTQHYFLMIGHLTHFASGEKFLERSGIVEGLMELIGVSSHAEYVKLAISPLSYGSNPIGKVVLCKALTASCEDARIYSCQFLALLMRLNIPGVQDWGMNLLVTQLLDQSTLVSETALKILEELCEDHGILETLITTMPPLMHLSEQGVFLLARLMSVPSGFKIFTDAKVLSEELGRWNEKMNQEYVRLDEEYREAAFDGTLADDRAYPLVHLYGQLTQHEEGFESLLKLDRISDYIQCLKLANIANSNAETLSLKVALWALGHIGSSTQGADWLEQEGVLSMMLTLSVCSHKLTVRATAFSAVNLVAKSERGRALIERYGWRSLLHERTGTSSHSSSFSSGSGSFSNYDPFPDSFRKPLFAVNSCPEVHERETVDANSLRRERGQSDSVVQVNMKADHSNNFVRSATVSTCTSSSKTSDSDPVQSHERTFSVAPSIISWPRMGKTATIISDPGDVGFRPYQRSFSALVGSQAEHAVNNMFNYEANDRSAKFYLVEKIAGRKSKNNALCVPVPVWNLFKLDNSRRDLPETVLEGQTTEGEMSLSDEVRRRILQMCGLRGQKTTENELLKLKQKHPEVFQNESLYESVCEFLNEHHFGHTARRFIQELFLDVDFFKLFSDTRRMFSEVRPQFAKSDETVL